MQRTTELLAASEAAGKQQQRDLEVLHTQLADIRGQLALAADPPDRSAQHLKDSGEPLWGEPSSATLAADPANSGAARIGCSVLLSAGAERTEPAPAHAAQGEQACPENASDAVCADASIFQGGGQQPPSEVAQHASHTQPSGSGVAAAAAQPDAVPCLQLDSEDAVHEPMAPARPAASATGYQLEDPPCLLAAGASAQVTDPDAQSSSNTGCVGNVVTRTGVADVSPESARAPLPGQCANLPADAPRAPPEQATDTPCLPGEGQRQHFLPALVEAGRLEPARLSTEGDTKVASSHEEGTDGQRKSSLEAGCNGGRGARSDQGETFSSRSVVDMFASLHYLQDAMDSDSWPEGSPHDASPPMVAAACGPSRKKRKQTWHDEPEAGTRPKHDTI